MHNTKRLIASVLLSVIACVACNKDQNDINKVINVSLNANETYNYQVPASDNSNGSLQISQQAVHASSSTLSFKNSTAPTTFTYIPVKDFSGSDEVVISNPESASANPHPHHQGNGGGCQGHHDNAEGVKYTFKITVGSAEKVQ